MHDTAAFSLEHFLFHQRLRCIYAVVPKAATTSIKHWFLATNAAQRAATGNVHDMLRATCTMNLLPRQQAAALFADPTVFKFSFVRNPWTRLVSGYLDKVVGAEPPALGLIRNRMKRTLAGRLDWLRHRLTCGVGALQRRGLTFREFVQALRDEKPDNINLHFRPQTRILAGVPLDFIGRMERFASDFDQVLQRVGETAPAQAEHKQQYQAASKGECVTDWPVAELRKLKPFPHWRQFYSPDVAQQVAALFADDFAAYGYAPTLLPEAQAA